MVPCRRIVLWFLTVWREVEAFFVMDVCLTVSIKCFHMRLNLDCRLICWQRWRVIVGFYLALTVGPSLVRADLVGWWKLDGNGLDSSMFAQHGQLVGEADFELDVPPIMGQGQSLRLSGDGFLRVDHAPHLSLPVSLSIAAWVKPVLSEGWDGIVSKAPKWGNWAGASGNYELRIENETRSLSFLHQLVVANDSLFYSSESSVVSIGVWSHVVITAGVRAGVVEVRYYINWKMTGTVTEETNEEGFSTNENPLFIGSRPDFRTGFDGLLNDVRLYNHELSVGEIESLNADGNSDAGAASLRAMMKT